MTEQPPINGPITVKVVGTTGPIPEADAAELERQRKLAEERKATEQQEEPGPFMKLMQFITSLISVMATGVWNLQKENYAEAGKTPGREQVDGVVAGGINGLGQRLAATWMTMGQILTGQKGTMRGDSQTPPRDREVVTIGADRNSTVPNNEVAEFLAQQARQQGQGESLVPGELSPLPTPQVAQSQSRSVAEGPSRRMPS